MAKCKICGGNVWCGVVLHTECFERLQPVWHPESDTPMTHVEYIETDKAKLETPLGKIGERRERA